MPNTNKITYGLCNCYVAPITEDENGTVSYGTPVALPGAISMSLAAQGERRSLYADNVEYWSAQGNSGYQGDLNLVRIPDFFRQSYLGEQVDESDKVAYETTELNMARFALLFQFEGDVKATRHILYNCSASRPSVASQSTDSSGADPTNSTETLSLTATGRRQDKLCKARTSETTPDRTYNTWFQSVWEPSVS